MGRVGGPGGRSEGLEPRFRNLYIRKTRLRMVVMRMTPILRVEVEKVASKQMGIFSLT